VNDYAAKGLPGGLLFGTMKFVTKLKTNTVQKSPAVVAAPFTIKFGLFMALLVSFLLPLAFFSPLLIMKMLGIPLHEQIGMSAANFGTFVLGSQTIALLISLAVIAKKLKVNCMSWSSVGLKGFKTFQGVRYIVGYYLILLGLLIVMAIIASSLGLQASPPPNNESGGTGMLKVMGSFWLTFVLVVIIAPIIEEIVFRGVLFPAIKRRFGLVAGILFSSLVFTLVHIDPIQMISVLPLGIYLAVMYHRTGSIYPGMILHATWNLIVLLIAQSAS
jgi:membrane protease YdiL (CAAX protease family)